MLRQVFPLRRSSRLQEYLSCGIASCYLRAHLIVFMESRLQDLQAKIEVRTHKEGHRHTCGTSSGCSSANNLNSILIPTKVVYKGVHNAKEIDSFLYNL